MPSTRLRGDSPKLRTVTALALAVVLAGLSGCGHPPGIRQAADDAPLASPSAAAAADSAPPTPAGDGYDSFDAWPAAVRDALSPR